MRDDLTIIYYTGHREAPAFEERIVAALLRSSAGIPIISVSQRPLSLGKNICVGEVGTSIHNAWRQLHIGVSEATTPYVCTAESDYLYPPQYFNYTITSNNFHMPSPMYSLCDGSFYLKPQGCEGALMAPRELLADCLEKVLGPIMWRSPDDRKLHIFQQALRYQTPPVVHIKTGAAMTKKDRHRPTPYASIPFWGSAASIVKEYL